MKWEDREESQNVEDRRGDGGGGAGGGGGGGGNALGAVGAIVVIVVGLALGMDPHQIAQLLSSDAPQQQTQQRRPAATHRTADPHEDKQASFTKVILHDTEVVWEEQFQQLHARYPKPVLVLFRDAVESACGHEESATGPFYCPGDQKVYIDLSFYDELERKLNSPGEFARAYVLAHEIGHHVQNLLGYPQKVQSAFRGGSRTGASSASVRLELQADYLAGVWAHHGQRRYHFLEAGDIDSAMRAAFEIGDDRLQKQAGRRVVPDSFTHGTSKQRTNAFMSGFNSGSVPGAQRFVDASNADL